jgi:hypothetical protein
MENSDGGNQNNDNIGSGGDGDFRPTEPPSGPEPGGIQSMKKEPTVQSLRNKDVADGKSILSMKIDDEVAPKSSPRKERVNNAEPDVDKKVNRKSDSKQKQVTPRNPKDLTKEKDRDANAQWMSEWEQRGNSQGGGKVGNTQRDANKYWEGTLSKRLDNGDTRMYVASPRESGVMQRSRSIDGLHQTKRKPKYKLGESKQKEASERKIGDFYDKSLEKKSVKDLTKREVSQGVIGDFYTPRKTDDFVTKLENESRSRRQSRQSTGSKRSRLVSREESRVNDETNGQYWLVMDLETNKGFKVKKASSPQSALRPDHSLNMSSAGSQKSSSIPDEERWEMPVSEKSVTPHSRWPWDKSADPRTRGKNHDDLFRKDKENVLRMEARNMKTKAPWETPDLQQSTLSPRKDPDDIFRKDPVLKEKSFQLDENGPLKVLAPWETPKGKSANDLDVLFGKPAYGKGRVPQVKPSKSFDSGIPLDVLPPSQRSKAEQFHRSLHGGNSMQ